MYANRVTTIDQLYDVLEHPYFRRQITELVYDASEHRRSYTEGVRDYEMALRRSERPVGHDVVKSSDAPYPKLLRRIERHAETESAHHRIAFLQQGYLEYCRLVSEQEEFKGKSHRQTRFATSAQSFPSTEEPGFRRLSVHRIRGRGPSDMLRSVVRPCSRTGTLGSAPLRMAALVRAPRHLASRPIPDMRCRGRRKSMGPSCWRLQFRVWMVIRGIACNHIATKHWVRAFTTRRVSMPEQMPNAVSTSGHREGEIVPQHTKSSI